MEKQINQLTILELRSLILHNIDTIALSQQNINALRQELAKRPVPIVGREHEEKPVRGAGGENETEDILEDISDEKEG